MQTFKNSCTFLRLIFIIYTYIFVIKKKYCLLLFNERRVLEVYKQRIPSYRSRPGPGSLLTYCTYLPPVRLTDLIYGPKMYPPEQRREEDGVVCQNDSLRLVLAACAHKCAFLNYCLSLSIHLCLGVTSALILSQLTNHPKRNNNILTVN